MDSLRLIICARAHCQQLFCLCRVCDRGQRYCSRACAGQARRVTLQGAGRLYQQSRPGRFRHAARQARYRARGDRREIVTHQTTQAPASSGIVASVALPSVVASTDEFTAEEATAMQTLWMGVRPGPELTRLLVQDGPIPILKARLPEAPHHPRALETLAEGVALWYGRPPVRCARCGRPGRFVRLTTLARHRGRPTPRDRNPRTAQDATPVIPPGEDAVDE